MVLDADGTPQWQWLDVVSGPALMFESRKELNDATGQTLVLARAVLGWSGDRDAPHETAVAIDSRGHRWQITSVVALPGRLEMQMEWLDDGSA